MTSEELEYARGYGKGMTSMKKMVLSVLREHQQMSIQEVAQYIRENL